MSLTGVKPALVPESVEWFERWAGAVSVAAIASFIACVKNNPPVATATAQAIV
jgi:hypothetical protein